jgi:hypothetical protein
MKELERGVHRRPSLDTAEFGRQLKRNGWSVFSLPPEIGDKSSFCQGVRSTLPVNPPLLTDHWDALSDSLWSGLDEFNADKIAIIWPGSAKMAHDSPDEFDTAIEIFTDLTDSLADNEMTVGHPKQVAVMLT